MKIAVIISNGTEELEALTPVDILKRAGVETETVSVCEKVIIGSHNIGIVADKVISETSFDEYDGIVIPGGMPGATIISENEKVVDCARKFLNNGKLVASICASPAVVLARHNLIDGKNATCYPSQKFIEMMCNSNYTGNDVEIDGNLITANGPKSAFNFSLEIAKYFGKEVKF